MTGVLRVSLYLLLGLLVSCGGSGEPGPSPASVPCVGLEASENASFKSSRTVLAASQSILFSWDLGNGAASCTLFPGDGSSYELNDCDNGAQSHRYSAAGSYVARLCVAGEQLFEIYPTVASYDPNTFNVDVVFLDNNLTPSQRAVFEAAAARWGEVITRDEAGYQGGTYGCTGLEGSFTGEIDDLVIMASAPDMDGRGGVLGAASPCGLVGGMPVYGVMLFDRADLAWLEQTGDLESTILHEMGHVLGIGTLWNDRGIIDEDAHTYSGAAGVDEYSRLTGDSETTVPAEDEGGKGTANGHWDDDTFGTELMTGYLSAGVPNPLSRLTIAGLEDVGYGVSYEAADNYSLSPLKLQMTPRGPGLHSVPVMPKVLEP